jgi:hypothetical protein
MLELYVVNLNSKINNYKTITIRKIDFNSINEFKKNFGKMFLKMIIMMLTEFLTLSQIHIYRFLFLLS